MQEYTNYAWIEESRVLGGAWVESERTNEDFLLSEALL